MPVAAAENRSHHRIYRNCFLPHNCRYGFGGHASAGDAAVHRRISFDNRFGKFITPGVAAGAAVGAGQRFADRFHAGIRGYGKKMRRCPQENAQDCAHASQGGDSI